MFQRSLDLDAQLEHKSVLLLGPRQTGKSTLLRARLSEQALYIDLLQGRTFQSLANDPSMFEGLIQRHFQKQVEETRPLVIVDEIQKLPALLDEVHRAIEQRPDARFVLTGSSARKLKRHGTNLLGGRARLLRLHPLCHSELASVTQANERGFTWRDLIGRSGIPSLLLSPQYEEDCGAYTDLYLFEEIQQEALVRRLDAFSRFLRVAAGANGHQIVFEKIASKAGLSAKVCKGYFEILSDTLVGQLLPSFKETLKRQPVAAPKFYLFDAGIARFLQGRSQSDVLDQGEDLETYILHELICYRDYRRVRFDLSYWRSKNQSEVDFVLSRNDKHVAIEVKTTRRLTGHDLSGLKALAEEELDLRRILVNPWTLSQSRADGVDVLSVEDFLAELWGGRIV